MNSNIRNILLALGIAGTIFSTTACGNRYDETVYEANCYPEEYEPREGFDPEEIEFSCTKNVGSRDVSLSTLLNSKLPLTESQAKNPKYLRDNFEFIIKFDGKKPKKVIEAYSLNNDGVSIGRATYLKVQEDKTTK